MFAQKEDLGDLAACLKGADVFLGLSKGNILTKDMVRSMAKDPIVFALANPVPEITYEDAMDSRPDVLMSTGRSDYPNQINNVIGFPYIFRGALDTAATAINEEMKLAAVRAIAELAKKYGRGLESIMFVGDGYDEVITGFEKSIVQISR